MKRTAFVAPRVQPSPRAARRSEWLRSALAHHHCPDPGVENEIVVLATGIDQYLQEVFHHLVYPNRSDTLSSEDFSTLCAVLGLSGAGRGKRTVTEGDGAKDEDDEEFRGVCSGLPCQLSFKDFHSRLCGYFRVRSARRGTAESALRLPVSEETELVEKHIRLRWPRARRRKRVSFDLTKDQNGSVNGSIDQRAAEERDSDELVGLRELVEDLRSALQGSDARCLALEVALRRERSRSVPNPPGFISTVSAPPKTSVTLIQGKLVPTQRLKGAWSRAGGEAARRTTRKRDIRDPLLRELNLIRSSRDGQLEEAIRFNGRLEEELRWAYQEVHKHHGVETALRKENAHIRRRAEEARQALSLGLERVRMIQEQAQAVPRLQTRITQLERELLQCRSQCTPDPTRQRAPVGDEASSKTECLQRAVEGRAASDEEEEEEEDRAMREERQSGPMEVEKHISRLHVCVKGCPNHALHQLPPPGDPQDKNLISTLKDSRGRCSREGSDKEQPEEETGVQKEKPEEEEDETRMRKKEFARLCLLEQKLTDVLTLLQQLRDQNVSWGALGKMVMETLDASSRNGDGPSRLLRVAEGLCVRLSSGNLLDQTGDDEGGDSREKLLVPSSGCQKSSINPLLISC
ncbi:EF-hand and coiled-coil domain-containing protein 1 isoform X2 [Antennarius striatus]|uniref:EF-hand and coiled-coil domain-containing protein 1 isoform X2 n=1 Tax=Antennarius striatus TaxID=241820 RepID=UPI0035B27F89